ncbi:hypothetical protein CLV32_0279 [Pedobacter duraquae]|uniref:Uncharacterized protein n=1 Tax=Pedobacter duraquae TaxID=425511 RepID=A0A4R6IP04_9SPHI|nr:hypothetical protein CLV32_0279 [Pedobacter duraquae]
MKEVIKIMKSKWKIERREKAIKKERVVPSRHIPILTKYKPV